MAAIAKSTAVEVLDGSKEISLDDKAAQTVVIESDEPVPEDLQEDEVKYVHGHPVIRNGRYTIFEASL